MKKNSMYFKMMMTMIIKARNSISKMFLKLSRYTNGLIVQGILVIKRVRRQCLNNKSFMHKNNKMRNK